MPPADPWTDSVIVAQDLRSDTLSDPVFRFHWKAVPFLDAHIAELKQQAATALLHDEEILGMDHMAMRVDILYFDRREDLLPLVGMRPKALALPERHTLLIATNDSTRAYHAHELMHVLSIGQWGRAAEPADWIQEGLAVYADAPCAGNDLYALAAYHLHRGSLLPLDTLAVRFRTLPDMQAYMQAGALANYLIDRFGIITFQRLWNAGWSGFERVTGEPVERFEAEYRALLLERYSAEPDVDWEQLLRHGCG